MTRRGGGQLRLQDNGFGEGQLLEDGLGWEGVTGRMAARLQEGGLEGVRGAGCRKVVQETGGGGASSLGFWISAAIPWFVLLFLPASRGAKM